MLAILWGRMRCLKSALPCFLLQDLTGLQKRAVHRRATLGDISEDNWASAIESRLPLLRLLPQRLQARFTPQPRDGESPVECVAPPLPQ